MTAESPIPPAAGANRGNTWDVSVGLGHARWGDDQATLRALYPWALSTNVVHGRHADTGTQITVPPALVIDDFIKLPGMSLTAAAHCGAGGLAVVDLYARGLFAQLPPRGLITVALGALSHRLGIEIVEPYGQVQGWEHLGASIDLYLKPNDFSLSVYAPGSAALGWRDSYHRAFRRLQAQRGVRPR